MQEDMKNRTMVSSRGYTLVEMTVVMAISGILLTITTSSVLNLMKGSLKMSHYAILAVEGRLALSHFDHDVSPASNLMYLSPYGFVVEKPLPLGGTEQVEYSYNPDAGTLVRSVDGIERVILKNIHELEFSYLTASSEPATNALEVIKIHLSARLMLGSGKQANIYQVETRRVMHNKTTS